ncbi:uncharacterized protein AMSG_04101 [Thecamonas trahens ATCC 50062]|uniref:Uncharacterized protein n=1 Tax=Thecamonas trahens ATCC 50062 TaxID=461836 RepID=A0A0L0D6Z3_THETB|nr:hypothetical protein AMSG_04101 [Thecamonas trahens ATCC 50062]KNC47871.1 hypothetical protein AMSG_04101 [Thecamonas trahens ATCC 50062]|eukprot:XP_013759349.1 hypothetical protein AMSG_04101 [Thecamonas trahens ATCC 50062]
MLRSVGGVARAAMGGMNGASRLAMVCGRWSSSSGAGAGAGRTGEAGGGGPAAGGGGQAASGGAAANKQVEEWQQRVDKSTGEFIYVNLRSKEVTSKQPEWYIPYNKEDSALVKFIKFDLVGDYDLKGKKLAAVIAAIVAVGLALDYKRGHGLFYYLMDDEARAVADAQARRRRELVTGVPQDASGLDDSYEYEFVADDDDEYE